MQIPNSTDNIFYTYEHIRNDNGLIFYVGKGKDKRAFSKRRNNHWKNTVKKAGGFSVRFLKKHVEEELAFFIEEERIEQLLNRNIKLCNLTRGGEGATGHKHSLQSRLKMSIVQKEICNRDDKKIINRFIMSNNWKSDKFRENMSRLHKNKTVNEETRLKISKGVKASGFKHTPEMLKKMSEAHKGKKRNLGNKHTEEWIKKQKIWTKGNKSRSGQKQSEEEKLKRSISMKGRKQAILICPHCSKEGGNNMKRWHFDNCKQRKTNGSNTDT